MLRFLEYENNPILVPEYPWEGKSVYLYGSVINLGDKLRMYYQSYVDGIGFFVCLAESEDGINWEKPLFRSLKESIPKLYPTVEVNGKVQDFYRKTKNLECMSNAVSDYHIPSVLYSSKDEYPYKLFGYSSKGYCVAFSKDGLHFEEYRGNPVISIKKYPNRKTKKVWFSDVAPVFYDTKKKIYRAMVKTYKIDSEGRTRRCVGMSTSRDFVNWTRPKTIWVPSKAEDKLAQQKGFKWADFYSLCPFNWKEYYLGFLRVFFIEREIPNGTHYGKIEVYLAYSKDCIHWERISDKPLISVEGWKSGTTSTANQPVRVNGRLALYFSGANFPHGFDEENTIDGKYRIAIGLGWLEEN
ncbi:hypothetical protein [Hydrogenivirga sp. 128-5-R1-1]|uniref:hypothetical protein n=1 Tax=Hydrogenivirga sp. 128-5-R1-1 TaxID=392423 RepID=UPI00015EF787|nr:hypothetical protein [Hydrogenivirga sp. 128-5-R1-1]EDP74919.1 hypothetical protein HG1285_13662 [Hydrogenivirga sp. 128-5-R1-1]